MGSNVVFNTRFGIILQRILSQSLRFRREYWRLHSSFFDFHDRFRGWRRGVCWCGRYLDGTSVLHAQGKEDQQTHIVTEWREHGCRQASP